MFLIIGYDDDDYYYYCYYYYGLLLTIMIITINYYYLFFLLYTLRKYTHIMMGYVYIQYTHICTLSLSLCISLCIRTHTHIEGFPIMCRIFSLLPIIYMIVLGWSKT